MALINAITGQELSYDQSAVIIARFGQWWKQLGLKRETILFLGPNCTEHLLAFFAAAQHGLGFAPLPQEAPPEDVARTISLVHPSLILACDTVPTALLEVLYATGLPLYVLPQDGEFNWLPSGELWSSLSPNQTGRLYLATSGSTGEPQMLVFDTDLLWSSALAFVGFHLDSLERRRFWNILPMSYLGGLFNLGLVPLAAGGSVVISEAFSGRSFLGFWQAVERFEIDVLWVVPTIMRGLLSLAKRIARTETAPLRFKPSVCLLGTAPIELATKVTFESVFGIPVLENFALSETTFLTSETLTNRAGRSDGSVGEVLPYVRLELRALAAGEEDLALRQVSPTQIHANSPYAFLGYLTAGGQINRPIDAQGFLATGDLGQWNGQNHLVVNGRQRDIIKKGGYFVALTEVEVLARTHPDVAETAAIGIRHPFYGEDYVLCLTPRAGASLDVPAFGHWLRQHLARYKWPDRIEVMQDFPRTCSGKIRKHLIRIPPIGEQA